MYLFNQLHCSASSHSKLISVLLFILVGYASEH